MPECPFCQKEKLMNYLPDSTPCKRGAYQDDSCFAILAPEQYTPGHTLLILEEHKVDITDEIQSEKLAAFINAIHKVSGRLKEVAENHQGKRPDRIYVGILCDGVQHLHAHLIPRYPFDERDIGVYRKLFSKRDGPEAVIKAQRKGDMGGFWYLADREANWKRSEFGLRPMPEQVKILEELARKLCTYNGHL